MARFVNAQVPEVVQPFWAALQRGEFIDRRRRGGRHVSQAGPALAGRRRRRASAAWPRPEGRCLSFGEREEIALGRARG